MNKDTTGGVHSKHRFPAKTSRLPSCCQLSKNVFRLVCTISSVGVTVCGFLFLLLGVRAGERNVFGSCESVDKTDKR